MSENPIYDIFLSHNSEDKPIVEELAARLEDKAKLHTFLDKWHLTAGEPWVEGLQRALEASKSCGVILGPSGRGPWQNVEVESYLMESVTNRKLRILPVLLPGTDPKQRDSHEIPLFLKRLKWIDFSDGLDNEEAFHLLVSGVQGMPPGRPKVQTLPADSTYVQKSIRGTIGELLKKFDIDIATYLRSPDSTLTFLAKRCELIYPYLTIAEIRSKLKEARAQAFEEKYSDFPETDDERYQKYDVWQNEFKTLLVNLGIRDFTTIRAISVGIGNGREHPDFYNDFTSLIGVDISNRSLSRAKKQFPKMTAVPVEAESLHGIDPASLDLYISLRTYQSTLFDIKESLFEAYRVLRPQGFCVISIPYVYYEKGELKKGLIRPGSKGELDVDLPYMIADKIRRELNRLDFDSTGLHTGLFEIYIYGQKGQ